MKTIVVKILAISLGLNVLLSAGVRRHIDVAGMLTRALQENPRAQLVAGDGTARGLDRGVTLTILYFHAPDCDACRVGVGLASSLAASTASAAQFVAVRPPGGLTLPTWMTAAFRDHYVLRDWPRGFEPDVLPYTAIVGRDGTVLRTWSGPLTAERASEIRADLAARGK